MRQAGWLIAGTPSLLHPAGHPFHLLVHLHLGSLRSHTHRLTSSGLRMTLPWNPTQNCYCSTPLFPFTTTFLPSLTLCLTETGTQQRQRPVEPHLSQKDTAATPDTKLCGELDLNDLLSCQEVVCHLLPSGARLVFNRYHFKILKSKGSSFCCQSGNLNSWNRKCVPHRIFTAV